jgi:hypothetical protein
VSSHCRIKRVRLKSGGVIVPLHADEKDSAKARMIRHAREIAGSFKDGEMVGHITLGWTKDGAYNLGYFNDGSCLIGKSLLPSWVADILRRDMITTGQWG